MREYYDRRYKVHIHYKATPMNYDKDTFIPFKMTLDEVLFLFNTTDGGCDGWSSSNYILKSAIIDIEKWGNIALIPNIKQKSLHTLVGYGVEIVEASQIYKDKIDAGIQMAYIAAKVDLRPHLIEEATNGHITEQGYIKLQKLFYDDFPEKFI